MMSDIEITGYVPGAIGRITELHGTYYAANWNMGLYFEARVATGLAEFFSKFDAACDGAWIAHVEGRIVGAILIDGQDAAGQGARLRFFILDPAFQGHGLGNRLMREAVDFCKAKKFKRVYLTTFAGLEAARHLYDKFGFHVYYEKDGTHLTGNPDLKEQGLELLLDAE
jgi:GNAT superfamily N-acetyltransferase